MREKRNEECLICGEQLIYLEAAEQMTCSICKKVEVSNCRCADGHYVCSECHMSGMDSFLGVCLKENSKNPVEILHKLMKQSFCHMHGPEHHILVGASLITAFKNAGGEVDLQDALLEMQSRGRQVPGGICGLWGSCGAAISTGLCISLLTGSSPLATESWGWCNDMTSRVLAHEARIGGPRCCKRNSNIAVLEAVEFISEKFGLELEKPEKIVCEWFGQNNQCIRERCPFHPVNEK